MIVSMVDRVSVQPDQIEDMAAEEEGFQRGEQLFRDSGVLSITSFPETVTALVKSSEELPYIVTITEVDRGEYKIQCTCPNVRLGLCKHGIALMLAVYSINTDGAGSVVLEHDILTRAVKYNDMVDALREKYSGLDLSPRVKVGNVPLVHVLWAAENLEPDEFSQWREATKEKPDRYPPAYSVPPRKDERSRLIRSVKKVIDSMKPW